MSNRQVRDRNAQEFKLKAVRLVKAGQSVGMMAKVQGIPKASPSELVGFSELGQLGGAGERQVAPEQMDLARLRAELARVQMERDIADEAAAYSAQDVLQVRVDPSAEGQLAGEPDLRGAGRAPQRVLRA